MLRVRALGLAVTFVGSIDLETAFFSFCVMSFNLAVKKKKVFGGTVLPKTSLFAQTPLFL
jgi:hypothetical protein